jgi:hypothetical protein
MRAKPAILILTLSILVFPISAIVAQSPAVVPDQVEEDWQLVIGTPDLVGVGPQITTSMSPVSDDSTPFAAFDLNYREYPSFQNGGMQIQVWSGKNVLNTSSNGTDQFATAGETVTWTQRLSLGEGGTVSYRVLNGQSTTWGTFGGNGNHLTVNYSTTLGDLSGYSPDTSVANSGASWESNLVTQLTLVQVRYYKSGQLIAVDTTPRNIIAPAAGN